MANYSANSVSRKTKDDVRDCGSDVHAILPLELGPHAAELRFVAVSRFDVVHDVDVDVVQDYTRLSQVRALPEDATEDNTSFCRGYLMMT